MVEKRTRIVPRGTVGGAPHTPAGPSTSSPRQAPASRADGGRPPLRSPAPRQQGLSATEADARARALREAGARQEEDNRRAQEAEARRAEEDARRQEIRDAAARDDAARAAREAAEAAGPSAEAPAAAGEAAAPAAAGAPARAPARRPGGAAAARPGASAPVPNVPPPPPSEADGRRVRTLPPVAGRSGLVNAVEAEAARRGGPASRATPERPVRKAGGPDAFSRGRLTVVNAGTESDRDRGPSLAAMRRRRDKKMGRNQQQAAQACA